REKHAQGGRVDLPREIQFGLDTALQEQRVFLRPQRQIKILQTALVQYDAAGSVQGIAVEAARQGAKVEYRAQVLRHVQGHGAGAAQVLDAELLGQVGGGVDTLEGPVRFEGKRRAESKPAIGHETQQTAAQLEPGDFQSLFGVRGVHYDGEG